MGLKTRVKRHKKFNAPRAKRKLDRLFSELILLRDKRTCQWCKQSNYDFKEWESQVATAKEALFSLEKTPPTDANKLPKWKQQIAKQKSRLAKIIAKNGEVFKMDNSHIIPREVLITRWDPKNSICLCFSCHKANNGKSWHSNPLLAIKWLRSHLGDNHCDYLLDKSQQPYEFTEAEALRIESDLLEKLKALRLQSADDNRTETSPHASKSELRFQAIAD